MLHKWKRLQLPAHQEKLHVCYPNLSTLSTNISAHTSQCPICECSRSDLNAQPVKNSIVAPLQTRSRFLKTAEKKIAITSRRHCPSMQRWC